MNLSLFISIVLLGLVFGIYLIFKDKDMSFIALWMILCFEGIVGLLGITVIIFSLVESLAHTSFSNRELFNFLYDTMVKFVIAVLTIVTAYWIIVNKVDTR